MMAAYIVAVITATALILTVGLRSLFSFVMTVVVTLLFLLSVEMARGWPTVWAPFPEKAYVFAILPPYALASSIDDPYNIRLYTKEFPPEALALLQESDGQPILSLEGDVFESFADSQEKTE